MLSGFFFFAAAFFYLKFDDHRSRTDYALALILFLLGLMSKSVIATLPPALLVVFWWKRGRLDWKKDIAPLLPFFVMGVGSGLFTAWMERTHIGAQGHQFTLSFIERCLIAGRAFWFYLAKLFWPAKLTFIYPRWHISQSIWWQYVFVLAAVALFVVLWSMRKRSRAPLAAFLFFGGMLFPVLGFVNVYPFVYSYVADHFQYLACTGNHCARFSLSGPVADKTPARKSNSAFCCSHPRRRSSRRFELETGARISRCGNALPNDIRAQPRLLAGV